MTLPAYQFDLAEAETDLSQLAGFDPAYTIVYHNTWSDFDGGGWIAVFERDGSLFMASYDYSPEVGDGGEVIDYEPVSEERAMEEIAEFEKSGAEIIARQVRDSPRLGA